MRFTKNDVFSAFYVIVGTCEGKSSRLSQDTANIETVCLLGKRKPDTTVKIGIDMEDYRRIRDEEKAE